MSRARDIIIIAFRALLPGIVFGLPRCELRDRRLHERLLAEHQLAYHAEVITYRKESSELKGGR